MAGLDPDQPGQTAGEDLSHPSVDLRFGLVVGAAAAVADPAQGFFGFGQSPPAGLSHGGGLLGGVDVGGPQTVGGAICGADGVGAQQSFPDGAPPGGQGLLALGAVVEAFQGGQAGRNLLGEALGPAGIGPQRHHEAHFGVVQAAEVFHIAQSRVGHHHQPGRQRRGQGLDAGHEGGQLAGGARVGPQVQRHPGLGGGLQGFDLPFDGPIRRPASSDQRRVLVVAGEAHRGEVQVQTAAVDVEAFQAAQQQLHAQLFGLGGDGVEGPAQPVVVEQTGRHLEQLGDGGRRRPRGDVIQRGRSAQPVGHQHGDDLAVGEQRLAPHGGQLVDDFGQPQPVQVVGHQQQRPDLTAGTGRRRIQAGERPRPPFQLAGRPASKRQRTGAVEVAAPVYLPPCL